LIVAVLTASSTASLTLSALVGLVSPRFSLDFVGSAFLVGNILLMLRCIADARRGAVSFVYAFFFLFFVAIPASVQVAARVFPFGAVYDDVILVRTYVLLALFQIVFEIAAAAGISRSSSQRRAASSIVSAASLPAGWVLTILVLALALAVGPSAALSPRFEADGADGSSSLVTQLLYVGRSLSLFLAIVLWARRLRFRRGRNIALSERLQLPIATLLFFYLNFPPALPRFQLLGVAIAAILLVADFFRFRTKLMAAIGGSLFLFFGFAQLKFLGGDTGSRASLGLTPEQYLLRVDFDAFKQVADTLIYVDMGGQLRGFESFYGMLLFWLPRSVWPGKPDPAGMQVSGFLGYLYTNVSSPLPAESYLFLGVAGVIIVAFVAGFFAARVEFVARSGEGGFVLYALIAGFGTIILRGSLNGVAPMFLAAFFAYAAYALADRLNGVLASSLNDRSAGSE